MEMQLKERNFTIHDSTNQPDYRYKCKNNQRPKKIKILLFDS